MAESPVSALDFRQQILLENARIAVEQGGIDYALAACAEILEAMPSCLPVRRLQRAAQLRQFVGRRRRPAKVIGWARWLLCGCGIRRVPPLRALRIAGRILAVDPTNPAALRLLAESAQELAWPETAIFAWEALRDVDPDNVRTLLDLGRAFFAQGRCAEALNVVDAILARKPGDAAAQDLMRHASIAETMARGHWDAGGSFREKLKNSP